MIKTGYLKTDASNKWLYLHIFFNIKFEMFCDQTALKLYYMGSVSALNWRVQRRSSSERFGSHLCRRVGLHQML